MVNAIKKINRVHDIGRKRRVISAQERAEDAAFNLRAERKPCKEGSRQRALYMITLINH